MCHACVGRTNAWQWFFRKETGMNYSKQREQHTANEEGSQVAITGLQQQDRRREGTCRLLQGQHTGHRQSWRLRCSVGLLLAVLLTLSKMRTSSRSRHLR